MKYLFDKNWFKKRQSVLLWLLNNPFIKNWFRYVLRINAKERITEITPSSFKVYLGMFLEKEGLKYRFRADFRTHNKYSKRLKYAFYPIWWVAHQWDVLVANKWFPAWNLGFDILTVYPDAGSGNTTVDGAAQNYNQNTDWVTIHDALTSSDAQDTGDDSYNMSEVGSSSTQDQWDHIVRSAFTFDTSALGAGATISEAIFSVYIQGKGDYFNDSIALVDVSLDAVNAVTTGDYDSFGTTQQASNIDITDISTSAYNDWTLNATGKGNINKTGISQFGLRNESDRSDTEPTWQSNVDARIYGRYADYTGTNYDPKLVITYTTAVGKSQGFIF